MNHRLPKMLRSLATAVMLLAGFWASPAFPQTVAVTHCQGGCPQYDSQLTAASANVVIHHLYAAGLNGDTGRADWVAYRLMPEAVGVASLLPRSWQPDRLVRFSPLQDIIEIGESEVRLSEAVRNSASPYGGAAALEPENRARLAPMTSFANTPYWPDLNNLSNMVPMPASLRLGAWLQLEQTLNRVVAQKDDLYVIAGPLFVIGNLSVNPSSVDLNPAAYFKVVADGSSVAAFIFSGQLDQYESYCDQTVGLEEIEEMAALSLFPGRTDVQESNQLLRELGCSL